MHVSGLFVQRALLAKMVSAGGRSKQSSGLDWPLLRAVYLPLRIERSRPSLPSLARSSAPNVVSNPPISQAAAMALPPRA
jgi:hypothetical protein